jgi:hypothetical protein
MSAIYLPPNMPPTPSPIALYMRGGLLGCGLGSLRLNRARAL